MSVLELILLGLVSKLDLLTDRKSRLPVSTGEDSLRSSLL